MAEGEAFEPNQEPKVQPLNPISNWFMAIGLWGIFLTILNMFGKVHPNYHVSWGGLLTFEFTNKAFEPISEGIQVTASDGVFGLLCVAMIYSAFNNIKGSIGFSNWLRGLVINETWKSLGGGDELQRTIAAWCLLLGLVFYFWYGIQHTAWIDVGVYSVSIALVGFGLALIYSMNSPEGDSNVD